MRYLLALHALLARNGLLPPLAAARVATRALPPRRQPVTMTITAIRTNVLQALNVVRGIARVAANGVLLRAPLNPIVPAESQANVSPFRSVIVTIVLLCVALMWTMPRTTLRRTFFAFFAIDTSLLSAPLSAVGGSLANENVFRPELGPIQSPE